MPTTMSEHKKALRKPPLCELLPVRDYLDGVAVQMDGSFVAGYELDGLNSYYHDDDGRNRSKHAFEALVRSLAGAVHADADALRDHRRNRRRPKAISAPQPK